MVNISIGGMRLDGSDSGRTKLDLSVADKKVGCVLPVVDLSRLVQKLQQPLGVDQRPSQRNISKMICHI